MISLVSGAWLIGETIFLCDFICNIRFIVKYDDQRRSRMDESCFAYISPRLPVRSARGMTFIKSEYRVDACPGPVSFPERGFSLPDISARSQSQPSRDFAGWLPTPVMAPCLSEIRRFGGGSRASLSPGPAPAGLSFPS